MKHFNTLVLLTVLTAAVSFSTKAQTISSATVANFGIDGDVQSGEALNGSFFSTNTDDWFYQAPNTGLGVIDTVGAAAIKSIFATGANRTFSIGMAYPRYSTQNGSLWMDARFIRDNIGLSGSIKDSTVFTNGAKNGMIPGNWGTNPGGSSVMDKTDIVDGYTHMRRAGGSNGNLLIMMGASTSGTSGNRFLDIELYKSRVAYDHTTGVFSNSGPVATGGHSAWAFNANGTISQIGDMDFTFTFSSASVTEIAVYIWTDRSTVQNITPAGFDFAGTTEFYGAGQNSTYGYAKIVAKNGASLPVWGGVNTTTVGGPVWGTNSKAIGLSAINYFSMSYSMGQMAEIGMDLTAMGIDNGDFNNPCSTPFSRMMIKSRSSASFTSALSDFSEPAAFMDAPIVPADIATPGMLNCNVSSLQLKSQEYVSGGSYIWSTTNGNIVSNPLSYTISVDQPGTYYLRTSAAAGCAELIDSVVVTKDIYKPIASANSTGSVATGLTAMILGGDETLSNYSTEFGGSTGLTWSWSGPMSYTSDIRDNVVTTEGVYTLVVTETRNGCKDTATTIVPAGAILAVKLVQFSGVKVNGSALLKWTTSSETDLDHFGIERSFDGSSFSQIGEVKATGNSNHNIDYSYTDHKLQAKNFYRLKMVNTDGSFTYSKTVLIETDTKGLSAALVYPNPFTDKIQVMVTAEKATTATIRLVNSAGVVVSKQSVNLTTGSNNIFLKDVSGLGKGMYILEMISETNTTRIKIIKQ